MLNAAPEYRSGVGWTLVLRSREIDTFRGCHRAWDLGALVRRGLVPRVRPSVFDLELAVRMGLAVYYFPAMDDWNRAIVRPLAVKGFNRAMSEQASAFERTRPLTPAQTREWQRHRRLGELLLTRYFDWADAADTFDSLFSDELVWSPIPDPDDPTRDLGTPDGRPIRFVSRFDGLVSDPSDEHWVLEHRVSWDEWQTDEALLDDDEALRTIWALEVAYPQLLVAGTIYNELRVHADDLDRFAGMPAGPVRAVAEGHRETRDMGRVRHPSPVRLPLTPTADEIGRTAVAHDEIAARAGTEHARRTWVRRARGSIDEAGRRIARDVRLMADPAVDVSPNPAPERCAACAFLAPCTAMQEGRDAAELLLLDYRQRTEQELEDAGLRRSDERAAEQAGRGVDHSKNVNFRWS